MKNFLTSFSLAMLFVIVGCNNTAVTENASSRSVASSPSGDPSTSGNPGTPAIQTLTVPQVRVKNYNQYNMTLEKLTAVNRATHNDLFESLKGSLPADNEIEGLTPFNLIAMTRLADAYCKTYVDREAVAGKPLYSLLSPNLQAIATRDYLFNQFLDADPSDTTFDSLRDEVENVLSNTDAQGTIFPGVTANLTGNKTLTVAACVTILASPYITILE